MRIPLNCLVNIMKACQGIGPAYFLQAINPETFSRRVTFNE